MRKHPLFSRPEETPTGGKKRYYLRRNTNDNDFSSQQQVQPVEYQYQYQAQAQTQIQPIMAPTPLSRKIHRRPDSVLCNTTNTSFNSPTTAVSVVESPSPVDDTTVKSDNVLLRRQVDPSASHYDYSTFCTSHPLRASKIKAFEQSEMTSKLFFEKITNEDEEEFNFYKEKKKGRKGKEEEGHGINKESKIEDFIIQIPGLSKQETKNLFKFDAIEEIIEPITPTTANTALLNVYSNMNSNYGINLNTSSKFSILSNNSVDKRLQIMKNAFKLPSNKDLVISRLQSSKLPKIFQSNHEFLSNMSLEELDLWEAMNEEFESDLNELNEEFKIEHLKSNILNEIDNGYSLLDIPFENLYREVNKQQELGEMVSGEIRRIIKDSFTKDSIVDE